LNENQYKGHNGKERDFRFVNRGFLVRRLKQNFVVITTMIKFILAVVMINALGYFFWRNRTYKPNKYWFWVVVNLPIMAIAILYLVMTPLSKVW
jgi:hypothetical protein